MVKYPVQNVLKFLNLGKSDAGVYHYSNLEYKYINKAFYFSETFRREVAFFVWAIAVGSLLLLVMGKYIELRKAMNLMEPVNDQKVLQTVSSVIGQTNLHRKVKVFYSDRIKATFTIGTLRPIVLLWGNDMRSDKLEAVLKHELMHVKNYDNMFQFLSMLALAINWYNPFCYYMFCEMRRLDEEVCDCRVVGQMDKNERNVYGDLILERAVYKGKRLGKMFIGVKSSSDVLHERINMIMKYKRNDKKSKMRTIIFMMSAAICVFSAASFSVLAYERPAEISAIDTELHGAEDISFALEDVEDIYLGIDAYEFESSDKIFIDEDGNTYPINDETIPRWGCSHDWQSGTASEHYKNGAGCTVKVYKAQRCSKCESISLGELISTTTYTTCPH